MSEKMLKVTLRKSPICTTPRQRQTLRGLGLTVAPSEANFVWLPLGERAVPFADRAREAGILVMALPGAGVRITVGSPEANERLPAFVRAAPADGL